MLTLPLTLTLTRCSSSSLRSPRPLASFELAPSSLARSRRDLAEIYYYSTGPMDGTGHQRVSLVTHAIRSPQRRTRTPVCGSLFSSVPKKYTSAYIRYTQYTKNRSDAGDPSWLGVGPGCLFLHDCADEIVVLKRARMILTRRVSGDCEGLF